MLVVGDFYTVSLAALTGLTILNFGMAAYTLWETRRYAAPAEVIRALHALQLDVSDIVDRVEMWQRRDRSRKHREDGADGTPTEISGATRLMDKATLRARAAQLFGPGRAGGVK
mgnify:FL=1